MTPFICQTTRAAPSVMVKKKEERRTMKKCLLTLSVLLLITLPALADQVVLKNGDRLTGTVLRSDGKVIVFKSDLAGEVSIPFDAITELTSTQNLHIALKDGKTVEGHLSASADSVTVAATPAPVTAAKAEVTAIRNDADQAAYIRQLHPSLTQGWAGGLNVSFALTSGNSSTKNFGVAFNAARKTSRDQISLYANSIYSSNDTSGASTTTANAQQGGARYDRNINPKLFAFGAADFQSDALQSLDLRSVLTGGFGYHALNTKRTTLNILGGINYTHESYDTFSRSFPAATLGEEITFKWRPGTTFTEKAYIFPDFGDLGQYRATFDVGAVSRLNKWLGWQASFGDIYVTNPPAGKKQNDTVFTTGLSFTFKH
jgi:putative salt-induced outer membrane protein YdiY